MATITLYANKVNQMPGMIKNVKRSVTDYKEELTKLRKKTLSVDKKVCNMDDILSQVQSSTQTQDQKIQLLDKVSKDSEEFITDTARIDSNVADVVNKRKDDFYEKYYYLKPECEKTGWEKFKDGCKAVGEWCKEHWKAIVTVIAVIAAIVVIVVFPAFSPLLLLIAKGVLSGAIMGGLVGGIMSKVTGGSFWKGFEDGAFMGAIMGAIGGAGGAVGQLIGHSCKAFKIMTVTFKVSSAISSGMLGFDLLSLGIGAFDPNNALVRFNKSLHSNSLYNGFEFAITALAVFSGGAYKQMKQMPHTCFVAGTMILTTAGLVAIENIKVGDKVIATDIQKFTTSEKTVVETYIRKTCKLIHLKINDEEITTTPDHPFYVKEQGFINAGYLQVGDQVITADGGSYNVEAIELEIVEEPETVYNFHVEDYYTYYVGESCILVHNECGGVRLPRNNGHWEGEAGNGTWHSENPLVNKVTGGKGIPFQNGRPDFSKWSQGTLEFVEGKLNGTRSDFRAVYEQIKDMYGLSSNNQAKQLLKELGLTPHHTSGTLIDLIPTDLHGNIPHIGAASDLRIWGR